MPKKSYTNLPDNYPVCLHAEQQNILDALHQAGVTEEMQFDSYEQQSSWYD